MSVNKIPRSVRSRRAQSILDTALKPLFEKRRDTDPRKSSTPIEPAHAQSIRLAMQSSFRHRAYQGPPETQEKTFFAISTKWTKSFLSYSFGGTSEASGRRDSRGSATHVPAVEGLVSASSRNVQGKKSMIDWITQRKEGQVPSNIVLHLFAWMKKERTLSR